MDSQRFLRNRHLLAVFLPVAALFCGSVVMSLKRYLWFDEILTYYPVTDNSLWHMLNALADRVDHAPPLYFVLAWFWAKVFSGSALSLRLFSSLGLSVACCLLYLVLYRIYKFWPAFIGVAVVFAGSGAIGYMNYEARFYGLFLAEVALAIFFYYKACVSPSLSKKFLFCQALIHGSMPLTHPYGFLYSAVIIIALILRDKHAGVSRKRLYYSMLSGWGFFLVWLPKFFSQVGILADDTWVEKASLAALLNELNFKIDFFGLLLMGAFIILSASRRVGPYRPPNDDPRAQLDEGQRSLEASFFPLICGLFSVPFASWLVSKIAPALFVSRYFLPTSMAYAFIIAALLALILRHAQSERHNSPGFLKLKNSALAVFSVILLAMPLIIAAEEPEKENPGVDLEKYPAELRNLPVVSAGYWGDGNLFLQSLFYSKNPQNYLYLLDDEVARKLSSFFMNRMMGAVGRNYLPDNVMDAEEFLAKHRAFLVLNSAEWYFARFRNDPGYRSRVIERRRQGGTLILVQRVMENSPSPGK